MRRDDAEVRKQVARVDALLAACEAMDDAAARQLALDALQHVLELYGEGLTRIVERLRRADGDALQALAEDELVAHLLLLHGLHPADVEDRVRRALDDVRPYLHSHGGDVELLGVEAGVARLRLIGTCSGCPSSTATLRTTIQDAIARAAPDVARIDTGAPP